MRTGYLAAFATLGYRYALDPALGPVREQLLNPGEPLLRPVLMRDPDAPQDRRQVLLVREPESHRGLLVAFGQRAVLLPWLADTTFFQRHAVRESGPNDPVQMTGQEAPWPRWPTHRMDIPENRVAL
jgi:hypothetical protein